MEPSEEFKKFAIAIQSCFTLDPENAVNEVVPSLMQMQADNLWDIQLFRFIQQ